MQRPRSRRVVITGLGVITALGTQTWTRSGTDLLAGQLGHPPHHAVRCLGAALPDRGRDPRLRRRASSSRPRKRAACRAPRSSPWGRRTGPSPTPGMPSPFPDPERVGVSFGTAIGGLERVDEGIHALRTQGLGKVNPFTIPSGLPNMPAFHVSNTFGAVGPSLTITTACATGTQAVGEGAELIRTGRADVVIAGGAEAPDPGLRAGRLRRDARPAHQLQRRARRVLRARSTPDARASSSPKAPPAWSSSAWTMPRRAAPTSTPRSPATASSGDGYHVAAPDPIGRRPDPHHALGPGGCRAGARGCRLHQRPRHLDADQRRRRDPGHQGRLRRSCPPHPDLLDQVDDRARHGRLRRHRGRGRAP